jgi:hypothetical protein
MCRHFAVSTMKDVTWPRRSTCRIAIAKSTIAGKKTPSDPTARSAHMTLSRQRLADYFRCVMARAILPTIARSLCERIKVTLNAQAAMHPMVPTMTSSARPPGAE